MRLHWQFLALVLCSHLSDAGQCKGKSKKPGTFSSPAASQRASFRYWLPDASVPASDVTKDLEAAAGVGAGGVEIVPFYEYGGIFGLPPPGKNWSTHGFGTPPFKALFRSALETHAKHGMLMDFALGPNQGQGVPAHSDDEGLQWDLVPFIENLGNGTRTGDKLPGWGSGKLIAAVSALSIVKTNVSLPPAAANLLNEGYTSYINLTVDKESITDITNLASSDGSLPELPASLRSANESWIFAFYEKKTLGKNVRFPSNRSETIWDNGSYAVDHFSAKGARVITSFWEEHILDDEIEPLLKKYGQNGWEDSLEIVSRINWTPDLPAIFKRLHGYEIHRFLPLIAFANNNLNIQGQEPGQFKVLLDSDDGGASYENDYRAALQAGYQEYLTTLKTWLNDRLGLTLRTQVSYGMPMEMAASIPFVDVPECESLGFRTLDGYRQYTGAAALAQKNVVSNELGAVQFSAYNQTVSSLLHLANSALSVGVNRFVIHALAFGANYSATTWPGHTGFNYIFSELWSRKQPAWDHGLSEAVEYLSRAQYTQQQGVARIDVAIYHHESLTNVSFAPLYTASDLQNAGYSYRYIVPQNLRLPDAVVKDGILGANGAAFKAMVLMNGAFLTIEAVEMISNYAKNGLPILIEGEPTFYPSGNDSNRQSIIAGVQSLRDGPNVHAVLPGQAAQALETLRVNPFARVQSNATWVINHRHDIDKDIDYIFVHGTAEPSQGDLLVSHTGIPYHLNAWTGKTEPVLVYNRDAQGILRIPIQLGAKQPKIFAFRHAAMDRIQLPKTHFSTVPSSVRDVKYDAQRNSLLSHVVSGNSNTPAYLSFTNNSRNVVQHMQVNVPPAFSLPVWNLTLEHWEAPSDLYNAAMIARKRNTTHTLTVPLQPWTALESSIHNASGVGYYTSSFTWTSGTPDSGAYLRLTSVLNAAQVYLNGHKTDPIDPFHPVVDIGTYICNGTNQVLVVVPSTMWNYLRTMLDDLRTAGNAPFTSTYLPEITFPLPGPSLNGLVGDVVIEPYRKVYVEVE